MKTWMLPWLFPVGMLATVVFFALLGRYAGLAAIGLALLLVPVVLWRGHFPPSREADDAQYWRFGRR